MNMIIEYKTFKYKKKAKCYKKIPKKLKIEDSKNLFLKAKDFYDGTITYFGIWCTEKYLVIATLFDNQSISYKYYEEKKIHTESHIKNYLNGVNNVEIISVEEFKSQLENITSILRF